MASLPHPADPVNSTEKIIKVAIIGGGIGGLSLALGLLKLSHLDVQVYEAAPMFSEIGAGVGLAHNAQRALELLGPAAKKAFDKHTTGNQWSSHSTTFIEFKVGTGEDEGKVICDQKHTNGMQSLHRAHFLDELVKEVPAQCAHFNKRLHSLEETKDEVALHFQDGTTVTADVVIGADGVHSKVRDFLLGAEAGKPVFSGALIYRSLVSMDKAIEVLGSEHAQNATMLCGPDKAVLSFPIDFGKTLNMAAFTFGHKDWPHKEWILPADQEELTAAFKGWGQPTQGFLKLLKTPTLSSWAIFESPPGPFFHKGRVAIMGDAAHACTPFQAQGAGQAIEDACVLSALFEKLSTPQDVPKALAAYDQVRRPRAQRVVSTSKEAGQLYSMNQPGVGDDLEKMKEKLETRMHWIWYRDLVSQNETAVKLFEEAV